MQWGTSGKFHTHSYTFAIILHQRAQTQLSSSPMASHRSALSGVCTPVLLPIVTFLQNKTPKMTWQNPCRHSYFWHCTEDCLGRSGFKWKKKGRQKMTSCTETDVLKETKRKIPLSPKNANNIDDQISRIVSKLVLFKFPSRYSLPFIYFDTKQACHLSEEKGETPQYVQAS